MLTRTDIFTFMTQPTPHSPISSFFSIAIYGVGCFSQPVPITKTVIAWGSTHLGCIWDHLSNYQVGRSSTNVLLSNGCSILQSSSSCLTINHILSF
ncbi:hypothetical protein HanOQP8_Chr11g0391161 [Helianthus annuus]|nr:hypothetical protein HanOQP8_Chr11g0391161 [Helianthus annuus]